jgi:hypothetical protein
MIPEEHGTWSPSTFTDRGSMTPSAALRATTIRARKIWCRQSPGNGRATPTTVDRSPDLASDNVLYHLQGESGAVSYGQSETEKEEHPSNGEGRAVIEYLAALG